VTVYLVRHAKAGDPAEWGGDDVERPLSKPGRRQAERLAGTLGDVPFARLISSPALRCVQTLEPLAGRLRVAVEAEPALAEGRGARSALELIAGLGSEAVALSTHGDVMIQVLDALVADGMELEDPFAFAKGCTWVLERDGERFVRGRYLPPPPGTKHA
jgi:8-oxo-dGTP diphosphatase